jgi:hypothetical protein
MVVTIQHIVSIGIFVSTSSLATADIEGRDIRFEDCPRSVQSTLTENARGGTIDDVELITFKGRKIYIADVELPRDRDL